jgi:3-deoxy-manno-octulosonate cytidylyltransferase (CMP-KDO synthetase)
VQHVYERAVAAESVDQVIVATDDQRIADAVESFGGRAVMTSPDHPNGTCRLAEVAAHVAADVYINVQGDEPEIEPGLIDLAGTMLRESRCPVATVASPFAEGEDPANPNIVKVVIDRRGRALYFSRALIPYPMSSAACAPLKHVGLYAYTRDFLRRYPTLEPTPLEHAERLEQLRILEHGYQIAVARAMAHHHGIDTPEQYEEFVGRVTRRAGA